MWGAQGRRGGAAYNTRFYTIAYTFLIAVELFMVLVYAVSQTPGKPSLDRGYLAFYLAAVGIGAVSLALDRALRRRERAASLLRYLSLNGLLLWGSLLSIYDVAHGNGGAALPQVMLFLAAGMRLPRLIHQGMNLGHWAGYFLLLFTVDRGAQTFYTEAINSGIYLGIACVMVHVADKFQTERSQALRKVLRLQEDNLDMMAERVRAAERAAEEGRVLRHDLRHVAVMLREDLDRGNYGGAREIAARLLERPAGPPGGALRAVTGIPEVDAALDRCAAWAGEAGVTLAVRMGPAEDMDRHTFALVFLNALENACHAVAGQAREEERRIEVAGEARRGQYYLEISNTYRADGVTVNPRTGLPAAREPGHGYGVRSIAAIVERQGGYYRFQAGERFRLQVIFPAGDQGGGADRQPGEGRPPRPAK